MVALIKLYNILYMDTKKCRKCQEVFREKMKLRRKTDPIYKFTMNVRGRILMALKTTKKADRTVGLLGCSINELRAYLESLFLEGMSWDNYGYYGWHIDHVLPCASFDLSNPEEQRKCFHYSNLQPLWAADNMKKSDKIIKKDVDKEE